MKSTLESEGRKNDAALTCDAFLGGRLSIWQPTKGYRAGVDPVLLAAAVDAAPGQSVLELGCGVGVASLCLQSRVTGLAMAGLELQADYADLARRNADANALAMCVTTGDLTDMPKALRDQSFDHVIANPPYYDRRTGTKSDDAGREKALGETTSLSDWIDAATRRLAPKGYLTVIQKADRLADLLQACDNRLGDKRILPLASRTGRPAELVILQARKGAKGPFKLLFPFILHDGAEHGFDGKDYTAAAEEILRCGKRLIVE